MNDANPFHEHTSARSEQNRSPEIGKTTNAGKNVGLYLRPQ